MTGKVLSTAMGWIGSSPSPKYVYGCMLAPQNVTLFGNRIVTGVSG